MDTLGIVEARSIAAGVELADAMVKVADVELLRASTICSGRYLIQVGGDREAVGTAVALARDAGRPLAGSFVLSNISPQVLRVLKTTTPPEPGEALGVIECRTVSAGIAAADAAVKRSAITLARLVTGQGINGKSYFVISGDVAAVEEAVAAARAVLDSQLIEAVVIPRPSVAVIQSLISAWR
jgi:microcompartment protein CcmL/EutN